MYISQKCDSLTRQEYICECYVYVSVVYICECYVYQHKVLCIYIYIYIYTYTYIYVYISAQSVEMRPDLH